MGLTEQINSQYFTAANALRGKKEKRRIVAYVESYDDVFFWRSILSQFETESLYFEVMLPSRRRIERGKKSVFNALSRRAMGQDLIACVDADYDYLLQGHNEQSAQMLSNPYVVHTYAYSIENLQCYAQSLHQVCVMVTLNDRHNFDFVRFFNSFSIALYPLLLWSIHLYRTGEYAEFTLSNLCSVFAISRFRLSDTAMYITKLQQKVKAKQQWLRGRFPGRKQQLEELDAELRGLGVTPERTYLYVQGHALFDSLVVPLLNAVCSQLRHEREMDIQAKAIHATQRQNELSCYQHSVEDIESMLKKNQGYLFSAELQRIKQDLDTLLQRDTLTAEDSHAAKN